MFDAEFEKIINLITERTGIIPLESHKVGIRKFIEKKIENSSISEFLLKVQTDKTEFEELINSSTINETYFFREEKQFSLLQKKIFPEWIRKNGSAPIKIWSAACSEGAEAYSIALLTKLCRIKTQITASDINTNVLKHCEDGVFKSSLIRIGDGESFKDLLSPYKNENNDIVFSNDIKSLIKTVRVNLSELDSALCSAPKNQDIIFVRNVFIYFSREMRAKILKTLSEKFLADNGLIFVSMNEIAQIDNEITPRSLEKICDGNVFYFRKKRL